MDRLYFLKIYLFFVYGYFLIIYEVVFVFEINGKMFYLMILINSLEIKFLGKIEVFLYKYWFVWLKIKIILENGSWLVNFIFNIIIFVI